MNYYFIVRVSLVFVLLITIVFGRALYYDELNKDDNTKLLSNEDEEKRDSNEDSSLIWANYNNDDDDDDVDQNESFDSYEERKFYARSLFGTTRPSHTLSAQTRQALIDILQKAIDQGWRPNLKHYNPATRFGRHRR